MRNNKIKILQSMKNITTYSKSLVFMLLVLLITSATLFGLQKLQQKFHRIENKLDHILSSNVPTSNVPTRPYYYLGNNTGLTFVDEGLFLYVDTTDRSLAPHLIASGTWEDNNTKLLKVLMKTRANIVDAGANHGYFSVIAAAQNRKHNRSGKIFCIEANPSFIALLTSSVISNGFSQSINIVNKILSDKQQDNSRFLSMKTLKGGSGVDSAEFINNISEQKLEYDVLAIESTTLDVLIPKGLKIDILRMDIQGYEFKALKGASRVLSESDDIVIFMELDPTLSYYSEVEDEFNQLEKMGFKFWIVQKNGSIKSASIKSLIDIQKTNTHDILVSKIDLLKMHPELNYQLD